VAILRHRRSRRRQPVMDLLLLAVLLGFFLLTAAFVRLVERL
jgi:hypothetical protein